MAEVAGVNSNSVTIRPMVVDVQGDGAGGSRGGYRNKKRCEKKNERQQNCEYALFYGKDLLVCNF